MHFFCSVDQFSFQFRAFYSLKKHTLDELSCREHPFPLPALTILQPALKTHAGDQLSSRSALIDSCMFEDMS